VFSIKRKKCTALYIHVLDITVVITAKLAEQNRPTGRPSPLKISGGPKLAHAALSRRAIDGPCTVM